MARSDGMECDESRCLDRQDRDRLRRRDGDTVRRSLRGPRPFPVAAASRHAAARALALALFPAAPQDLRDRAGRPRAAWRLSAAGAAAAPDVGRQPLLFRTPLRVGDIVQRTSTIEEVASKEGKSGSLVFVKVRHEIHRDAAQEAALVEWHDIVYRAAPRAGQVGSPARPAPEHATWTREWRADDVLLFRYSALTFNGHRIHYDRRYATEVEGYPGLVVHGPLLATLLLDLVRREQPEAEVTRYEFRAMRPIFDLHPFHVCGEPQSDAATLRLWVRDHEGALAMDATAHIDQGLAKTRR